MADFSNRQLAEIITQVSEKITQNVLKERKIANDLEVTSENLTKTIDGLKSQVSDLKTTSIEPDLSDLNKFYEEKTEQNIKRLNSRLNVPNLNLYIWLSSLFLFLLSVSMIWFNIKSNQDILSDYREDLEKENRVITTKERDKLLEDMMIFFEKNPKTKDAFIKGRRK